MKLLGLSVNSKEDLVDRSFLRLLFIDVDKRFLFLGRNKRDDEIEFFVKDLLNVFLEDFGICLISEMM